jgi:probable HAF family extracellular repeat protein
MASFHTRVLLFASILGMAAVQSGSPATNTLSYSFLELKTLGGAGSDALAINAGGRIVGWADTGQVDDAGYRLEHAVLWTPPDPAPRDLGTLGGLTSEAYGINRWGVVVGGSETDPMARYHWHGFRWHSEAGMHDIGGRAVNDSPFDFTNAEAINDSGRIVGQGELSAGEVAAYWERGGSRLFRPTFPVSDAPAINNAGMAVGSLAEDGCPYGVVWAGPGGDSRSLTGPGDRPSGAWAINDLGQVLGWSNNRDVFVWQTGRFHSLPQPDCDCASPLALNNRGLVVGCVGEADDGSDERAIAWHQNRIIDLNDVTAGAAGWVLQSANSVNDGGEIVGIALHAADGQHHAFVLIPSGSSGGWSTRAR